MGDCPHSLDGEHHYAPRKWLAHDAQGRPYDALVKENWRTVLACVCGFQCPPELTAEVEARLRETQALKRKGWGKERGRQERLL